MRRGARGEGGEGGGRDQVAGRNKAAPVPAGEVRPQHGCNSKATTGGNTAAARQPPAQALARGWRVGGVGSGGGGGGGWKGGMGWVGCLRKRDGSYPSLVRVLSESCRMAGLRRGAGGVAGARVAEAALRPPRGCNKAAVRATELGPQ